MRLSESDSMNVRDPGNPREATQEKIPAAHWQGKRGDLAPLLTTVLQALCLVAFFVVLLVGTYYALLVFLELGKFIKNPATAKEAVEAVADHIDADRLSFGADPESSFQPGKLIAFVLYLFLFILWFWIPMALIALSGRVILRSLPGRGDKVRSE